MQLYTQKSSHSAFSFSAAVYDFMFVQFIATPAFVIAWRGTWENADTVFDELICKGDLTLTTILSLAVGIVGSAPLIVFQGAIARFAAGGSRLKFILVSRGFTMARFYCDLIMWKGVWNLLDYVVGTTWQLSLACLFCASGFLTVIRTFKATLGTPFGIRFDRPSVYISVPTALCTNPHTDSLLRRILDCAVTITLAMIAVVAFYGIWTSEDYFFDDVNEPDSVKARNAAVGTAFGYMCNFIAYCLQFLSLLLHSTEAKIMPLNDCREFWNESIYQVILWIGLAGDVSTFRGMWDLIDVYFIPDNPLLSRCLCQFVGLFLMYLLYIGSTLHGGVVRERNRQRDGILISNFFCTYLLATKIKENSAEDCINSSECSQFGSEDDITIIKESKES